MAGRDTGRLEGPAAATGEPGQWKSAQPRALGACIVLHIYYISIFVVRNEAPEEVVSGSLLDVHVSHREHLSPALSDGSWVVVSRPALWPRRAGRTGTGSCPRTRPPGNAAPHHAEARAQTRPVFRSSPRGPRAVSSVPPSSPEGQPVPPPRLCPQRVRPQVQPARGEGVVPAHLCPYGADPGLFLRDRKRQEQLARESPRPPPRTAYFKGPGSRPGAAAADPRAVQAGVSSVLRSPGRLAAHAGRHRPCSLERLTQTG